jgi:phage-related protein
MGNAKRNLRAFPVEAQKLIGDELQLLQFGGMPVDAKPFKGVGSGVLSLRCGMTEMHFARLSRSNWERRFTCCTRFRKSRSEELKRRNKMSI